MSVVTISHVLKRICHITRIIVLVIIVTVVLYCSCFAGVIQQPASFLLLVGQRLILCFCTKRSEVKFLLRASLWNQGTSCHEHMLCGGAVPLSHSKLFTCP